MVEPGRAPKQTTRFRQLQVPILPKGTVGRLRALKEPHYVGIASLVMACIYTSLTTATWFPERRVIWTRRARRGLGEGGLVNWQCRGYPVSGCGLRD